jgi:ABC-2 type transport system ATP-binding protein
MRARAARTLTDALLERMTLAHVANKRVDDLSGGMAQRLMIARGTMHRPAVLFLDEPTAGLDPQSRIAVHDIVGDLNRDGQTIMLITHDMQEADVLSHRVAIIDHGRLLALDTPTALKRSVDADTVVTVSADGDPTALAAALSSDVAGVRDARPVRTAGRLGDGGHGNAVMFTVRGDHAILPKVIAAADRLRLVLREVRIDEPTLETVFIHLTGKELRES